MFVCIVCFVKTSPKVGLDTCFKLLWMPKHKWKETSDEEIQFPDDLHLGSLRDSDTDFVDEMWDSRFPGGKETFREKIASFPNMALRKRSDDRLVAFCLTDHLGYGTHGYVSEERRGAGLYGKIMSHMYQTYLQEGIIPYGLVLPSNTSSIRGMKKQDILDIQENIDI